MNVILNHHEFKTTEKMNKESKLKSSSSKNCKWEKLNNVESLKISILFLLRVLFELIKLAGLTTGFSSIDLIFQMSFSLVRNDNLI